MEPPDVAAMPLSRRRASLSLSPRRTLFVAAPAILWTGYVFAILGYAALRSIADDLLPARDPIRLERALFGSVPTLALQNHIYARDVVWFDFGGFLLHVAWFALPLGFGIVVTIFERRRLAEYLLWLITAAYLSDVFYALLPTTPPWMTPGIHRVLAERAFVTYTQLDDNPFAAFPSLHAGFPLVIGLFFLLRCGRTRRLGWVAVGFAVAIGFDVVYLGEHWVIDVVGGYALAGGVAWLFTSSVVRAALGALPGNVVGRITALNDALSRRDGGGAEPAPVGLQPQEEAFEAA